MGVPQIMVCLIHSFFVGQRLGQWKKILANWTEVVQPMPSHFDASTRTCSRIDRAFVFGPSNMLIKLHIRSYVQGAPEDWHGSGLSDHAPALVAFGRKSRNGDSISIPKFVCKHPNFSLHVQAIADQVKLLSLPGHKQLFSRHVSWKPFVLFSKMFKILRRPLNHRGLFLRRCLAPCGSSR